MQRWLHVALSTLLVAAQVLVTGALCLLVVSALVGREATEPGIGAVAVALVVVSATAPPAQRWIREGVGDLLATADAGDASALVTLRIGEREDPEVLLRALAETVREILDLVAVEIVVRSSAAGATAGPVVGAGWAEARSVCVGRASGAWLEIPLVHAGRDLGLLRIQRRSRGAAGNDLRARDLARHVALVISSSVLREELEASREALVRAREEERRRIRRDLHDGLGPSLAAIKLEVSAARRRLEAAGHDASALEPLRSVVGDATEEVRRVIEDLRPPLLDELGLIDALRNLRFVPDGFALRVEAVSPVGGLPAAVEVAAYRIASEAIRNAIRHARATACEVTLELRADLLQLTVRDDGTGLPDGMLRGVGVAAMHERADELGGSVRVQRVEPCGTLVSAVLRCEGRSRP